MALTSFISAGIWNKSVFRDHGKIMAISTICDSASYRSLKTYTIMPLNWQNSVHAEHPSRIFFPRGWCGDTARTWRPHTPRNSDSWGGRLGRQLELQGDGNVLIIYRLLSVPESPNEQQIVHVEVSKSINVDSNCGGFGLKPYVRGWSNNDVTRFIFSRNDKQPTDRTPSNVWPLIARGDPDWALGSRFDSASEWIGQTTELKQRWTSAERRATQQSTNG